MENLPSRNELQSELKRRGLPRAYIARFLAELDDHFTDLLEERNSRMGAARKLQFDPQDAEERLGEPTQLAIFAAEQYHARSFFGRHPVLTFLVAPLPLLWFGLVIVGILFFATGKLMEGIDWAWTAIFNWPLSSIPEENHPFVQAVTLAVMCWAVLVLPSLFAGWVLCRVAARNALNWKWPVLACCLLAAVAAVSTASYRIKTVDQIGTFMIGFYASTSMGWMFTALLPKFALAMAIGLLLLKRAKQRADLQQLKLEA